MPTSFKVQVLFCSPITSVEGDLTVDIWHFSSDGDMDYFEYMSRDVITALTEPERQWVSLEYESLVLMRIRERYIEIYHQLQGLKNMDERKMLLEESHTLLNGLDQKQLKKSEK